MSKSRKSPFEEAQEQIDIRLGGLLGEIGAAVSEALEKLDGDGEVHTIRTFDSGRGPVRASAGIRIRPLGGGASHSARAPDRPINDPKPDRPPEDVPRDISATILDDAKHWRLIAELPGIGPEGVSLETTGATLIITAEGRGRKYQSTFDLPMPTPTDALDQKIQNGILEITLVKPEQGA